GGDHPVTGAGREPERDAGDPGLRIDGHEGASPFPALAVQLAEVEGDVEPLTVRAHDDARRRIGVVRDASGTSAPWPLWPNGESTIAVAPAASTTRARDATITIRRHRPWGRAGGAGATSHR